MLSSATSDLISQLKKRGANVVALQLPAGLKRKAAEYAGALKAAGFEVIISGDPCYGACDLALDTLEQADVLVHIGHTPVDAQNRVIAPEEMFRGTLTQTSVYPRDVVKRALSLNAAAVILAHNHPSGVAEPSRADEFLTQSLRSALALVDIRVLDHIVIAGSNATSFAERGLL